VLHLHNRVVQPNSVWFQNLAAHTRRKVDSVGEYYRFQLNDGRSDGMYCTLVILINTTTVESTGSDWWNRMRPVHLINLATSQSSHTLGAAA
jgi:hypothetical protein